jgi:hypothetical protein
MQSRHPGKIQIWSYEWGSHKFKGNPLDLLSDEGTRFASAICAHCEHNKVRRRARLITEAVYSRDLTTIVPQTSSPHRLSRSGRCHLQKGQFSLIEYALPVLTIILQSLCLLKREYLYGNIFRRIHGVVFLNTPHLTNPDLWNDDLSSILCGSTTVKRSTGATPALKTEADRDLFVQICGECDFGVFPGQVISGYSTTTGVSRPRTVFSKLRKRKKPVIVRIGRSYRCQIG